MKNKKIIKLVLGFWILLLLVVNIVWLFLDKMPPAWDSAAHLKSMVWINWWIKGQFWGDFGDLLKSFSGYPPLIYFLGGMWSWLVGLNIDRLVFLNTLFLIGSVLGVYKLTKELVGEDKLAVLAAVVFSLLPVINSVSREMLLDLPLLMWVVWGLYFWIKSDDLKKGKYSFGLLLMLIFASLTKLNGFLYFVPIGILILFKNFRDINIWVRLVIGGLIYIVAMGWWWFIDWKGIYQYLTGLAGQGESLTDPMNLLEWRTWIYYLKLFFLHQVGPITTLCFGFFAFFIPKNEPKNRKLFWWTVIVYVIFTVVRNKDYRFTLPILISVVVWLVWGLNEFGKRVSRKFSVVMIVLLFVWLIFNFWENSFGWPIKKPVVVSTKSFLFEDIDWIGFDDYPVKQINKEEWPTEKIIDDLLKNNKSNSKNILVLIDLEQLNNSNLNLYKLMMGENSFNLNSLGGMMNGFESDKEIVERVEDNDYFLISEKDYEAAPFYVTHLKAMNQMRDWIWENIDEFKVLEEYVLPNQKKIYLMEKIEN